MSYYLKKYSWNGNEAISMAAHMILELDGINQLDVKNWLEYDEVNWIEKSSKPHKKTLLHEYIKFVYYFQYEYLLDKHFPMEVINPLIEIMDIYKVDYSNLGEAEFIGLKDDDLYSSGYDSDEVEKYGYRVLEYFLKELGTIIIDDIFTVLFSNKQLLYDFNNQLRDLVLELEYEEYPQFLKKDGVFQRCTYIPSWMKKGIYMRDKGRCQICGTDLTMVFTMEKAENYDHIIPLEIGGINDPTNFQLTCEGCNKSKGARNTSYNSLGARFWDIEES